MVLLTKSMPSSSNPGKKEKSNDKAKKSKTRPAGTKCHFCGKQGHWAPEYRSRLSNKGDSHQSGGSANLAVEQPQSPEECEVGKMLMASNNTISSASILLDCGATLHMFTSREHFITYIESSNEFVTVGGYNWVSVAGQGSVLFFAKLPNSRLNITLCDVLHIPHLGANLVSLGALHHQGISVKSFDKGLILSKDNEELFRASLMGLTGTLYHIQSASSVTGTAYLTGGPLSMRLWHRHMGHLSPLTIDSIQHQNLVKGLEITIPHDFDHIYSGCANAKSHRFPFPESSKIRYSKMELVVMDLTGTMSVSTWDGFLYALVVIEVSCRYPVERLLYSKEDTGIAIYDVLAMLER